jgi:hypothetical protein
MESMPMDVRMDVSAAGTFENSGRQLICRNDVKGREGRAQGRAQAGPS